MLKGVPQSHPLRRLLGSVTERCFLEGLGWPDLEVTGYVAELLVEFTRMDNVYKIRSARGRPVEDVAGMLWEGTPAGGAASVDREREIHKHIGDFTLFMSGLFPEFLRRMKHDRMIESPDALLDYIRTGKRSYRMASEFSGRGGWRQRALYRRLSENFELCVYGLETVRRELEHLRDPNVGRIRGALLG